MKLKINLRKIGLTVAPAIAFSSYFKDGDTGKVYDGNLSKTICQVLNEAYKGSSSPEAKRWQKFFANHDTITVFDLDSLLSNDPSIRYELDRNCPFCGLGLADAIRQNPSPSQGRMYEGGEERLEEREGVVVDSSMLKKRLPVEIPSGIPGTPPLVKYMSLNEYLDGCGLSEQEKEKVLEYLSQLQREMGKMFQLNQGMVDHAITTVTGRKAFYREKRKGGISQEKVKEATRYLLSFLDEYYSQHPFAPGSREWKAFRKVVSSPTPEDLYRVVMENSSIGKAIDTDVEARENWKILVNGLGF